MIISLIRIFISYTLVFFLFIPSVFLCLFLIPFRVKRIYLANILGTLIGKSVLSIFGCPLTIHNLENMYADKPCIYLANHISKIDFFIAIWLCPMGTVGIAKKQLFYYPFIGQLWYLLGHLFVDRKNIEKDKKSLQKLSNFVYDNKISIFIFPEGTYSDTGNLLPFKKGFFHLAMQTGLPIVPFVIKGTEEILKRNEYFIKQHPIDVTFLPPIDINDWKIENKEEHIKQVRQVFLDFLEDKK